MSNWVRPIVAANSVGTTLFATTIGLTRFDIKRVIAYSTCSQLGYMFFAAGVGAYGAAIFHLFTHAFFRGAAVALDFGSVIHAMSGEQDMRKMGRFWKKVKITYAVSVDRHAGANRLPRASPASSSKDAILKSPYASHNPFHLYAFWCGILAAVLTAFTPAGSSGSPSTASRAPTTRTMHHVHESPPVMPCR